MESNVLTDNSSTSCKNLEDTEFKASTGHSWNQSIHVQLVTAGNFRLLTLNVDPTGEKHNTTYNYIYKNNVLNFFQLLKFCNSTSKNYKMRILKIRNIIN